MRIDPRELPMPMQEQLAEKILAQLPAPTSVAREKSGPEKVRVRCLRFHTPKDKWRYLFLRDLERKGKICDLVPILDPEDGCVCSFTYIVTEEV